MKITNKDICKQLKEMDGQDWQFEIGFFSVRPRFYVKGKSVNDLRREYRTQIPLTIHYTTPIDAEEIEDVFENLDWSEVYRNSTVEYTLKDGYHKVFKHDAKKSGFNLVLDSFRLEEAVERAFENTVKEQMIKPKKEKSDEGRGGK